MSGHPSKNPEMEIKKQSNPKKSAKNSQPVDSQEQVRSNVQKNMTKFGPNVQFDNPQKRKQVERKQVLKMTLTSKPSPLFSHLPQYELPSSLTLSVRFTDTIHPAVFSLGLKYVNKQIQGSSARCLAMIDVFDLVITEHEVGTERRFATTLDAKIKLYIQFLIDCRPLSVGMGAFIKILKASILKNVNISDNEAKENILEEVSKFRKTLLGATEIIEDYGVKKIADGDVIMVYSASYNVKRILLHAQTLGKKFSVIVVDSGPKYEGRTLLKQLTDKGIKCIYALITAVSYLIQECSKVLLGAHSLLSNSAVVSRNGSAIIAMMAHNANVPVLVACETFKFHDRAQLDSICWNELGDPSALISSDSNPNNVLSGWKSIDKLILLNLAYDVTPMEHVSVVVTEIGLIPPTSVPVIIDTQQKNDNNEQTNL